MGIQGHRYLMTAPGAPLALESFAAEPAAGEVVVAIAGCDDPAGDLVPERERQRMVGAHTVVVVAEVGVADAATGDRDDHLAGRGLGRKRLPDQGSARRRHQVAMAFDPHPASPPDRPVASPPTRSTGAADIPALWYRNTNFVTGWCARQVGLALMRINSRPVERAVY